MTRDNLSFYEPIAASIPVSILSVPLDLGSDVRGASDAPEYVFANGLRDMLASIRREVSQSACVDCGGKTGPHAGGIKHAAEIAGVAARTHAAVHEIVNRGELALVLGGDHSVAIGSITGALAAHPGAGLIYIDAHPDCNTDITTSTGNVHGFVVSAALGDGHPLFANLAKNNIDPSRILFIGLKDFDEAEIAYLREKKIKSVTMLDIDEHGVGIAIRAIRAFARRVPKAWVSMDMDSVDQRYAPGVGMPNTAGLTAREILSIAQVIGQTVDVCGIDLVEMVPSRDSEGKTVGLALEILARLLGGEYSWYRTYMESYERARSFTRGRAQGA